MFANVRYIEDNVRKIVPIRDIKNFHSKNVEDFNVKKRVNGEYFDGQIMKLADSAADLSKVRIPLPPVESDNKEPASTSSGSGIRRKEKKALVAKVQKKTLLQIMTEKKERITKKRGKEESDEEVSVPLKLHEKLQEKYILLKKKCKENEMMLAEKTDKVKHLTEQNKELSKELKTIRSLNLRLQDRLLSAPGILQQSHPVCGGENSLDIEPEPEVVIPELDEDGKIKLGPGVCLTKEKWEKVQEAKSHSLFCKSLAVAIWGTEELKERSVTGAKSNAVKESVAKQPLSPEKIRVIRDCLKDRLVQQKYPKEAIDQQLALVRRSLAEKISDIRKRGLQKERTREDSQLHGMPFF